MVFQKRQQIQDMLAKHKELTKKTELPSSSESEDDSDDPEVGDGTAQSKNAWMKPTTSMFAPISVPRVEPSTQTLTEVSDGEEEEEDVVSWEMEDADDGEDEQQKQQETGVSTLAEADLTTEDDLIGGQKGKQNGTGDEKEEEGRASKSPLSSEKLTLTADTTEDAVGGKKKRKQNGKKKKKKKEGETEKESSASKSSAPSDVKTPTAATSTEDSVGGKKKKKQKKNKKNKKEATTQEESSRSDDDAPASEEARPAAVAGEDGARESNAEAWEVRGLKAKKTRPGKQPDALSSEEKTLLAVVRGLQASEPKKGSKGASKTDPGPSSQTAAVTTTAAAAAAAEAKAAGGQSPADALMTIAEAFDDDDVVEEFAEEKRRVEEEEQEKDVDLFVPGWGAWAGAGMRPSQRLRNR